MRAPEDREKGQPRTAKDCARADRTLTERKGEGAVASGRTMRRPASGFWRRGSVNPPWGQNEKRVTLSQNKLDSGCDGGDGRTRTSE